MLTTDLLTVGEVAHRSGFAPSALRFYERQGLLRATRTSGGQRRYERYVLRRLAFIRAARNVGLTLDEVAAALDTLPDKRTPTKEDWSRLSRTWRQRLTDEIAATIGRRARMAGPNPQVSPDSMPDGLELRLHTTHCALQSHRQTGVVMRGCSPRARLRAQCAHGPAIRTRSH